MISSQAQAEIEKLLDIDSRLHPMLNCQDFDKIMNDCPFATQGSQFTIKGGC
jgi:hypothetical protein